MNDRDRTGLAFLSFDPSQVIETELQEIYFKNSFRAYRGTENYLSSSQLLMRHSTGFQATLLNRPSQFQVEMLINALEILHVCWFCLKLGQVSSRLSLTNYKLLYRPWAFELVLKLVPAPLCFQVAALKRCSSIESMNRFQLFLSLFHRKAFLRDNRGLGAAEL